MTSVYAAGGLTLDWVRQRDDPALQGPNIGGNAAYAAAGARLAGASAEVVAVLGADYPPRLLGELEVAGIGTSWCRETVGPTFRVLLDHSGDERVISYLPGSGSNADLDPVPDQLPAEMASDGLHICAIPTASQASLIDDARGRTGVITLDTVHISGQIEPTSDELIALARRVDVFLPSVEEVDRFWPGGTEAALRTLVSVGVARVVVKLGDHGSIGIDHGEIIRIPAVDTVVVDTTGAGDSYCGAFNAALARGMTFGHAMAWGAAAASIVIEDYGVEHTLTEAAATRAAQRYSELERFMEVVSVP